jgi:hypothetical protein
VSTNPFEPPRSTDLEGGGAGPGELALSEAALQELSASAGWVRWCARFTLISIVVGIIDAFVSLFGTRGKAVMAGALITALFGTGISIGYLAVLRRYAVAAERLRAGTRQAAVDVVFAQSAYFKLSGVMTIVALALLVLVFVVGLAAAMVASRARS